MTKKKSSLERFYGWVTDARQRAHDAVAVQNQMRQKGEDTSNYDPLQVVATSLLGLSKEHVLVLTAYMRGLNTGRTSDLMDVADVATCGAILFDEYKELVENNKDGQAVSRMAYSYEERMSNRQKTMMWIAWKVAQADILAAEHIVTHQLTVDTGDNLPEGDNTPLIEA